MIKLINLNKSYTVGGELIKIFTDYNLQINKNEKVLIVGTSGSGKSTLLNMMSTMDTCDSGDVIFNDINLAKCSSKTASLVRLNNFGFIFQSYQLIRTLTVYDNIILPLAAAKKTIDDRSFDVLVEKLCLKHRLHHYPHQLSGGEQQRTAIARALIKKPDIIFADEPTGNLDLNNSLSVMELLTELCEIQNTTLIMVTHDLSLSKYVDRVISIDKEKPTI